MVRVFKLKLDALLKDLLVNGVLGEIKSLIWVVEYQKRGFVLVIYIFF